MSFVNTFRFDTTIQSFVRRTAINASQNQAYNPTDNVFYAAAGINATEPINIFDANSLQLIGTFNANSNRTRGIIYNPVNNRIYVQSNPSGGGGVTLIFDCATKNLVETIPAETTWIRYRGIATPDYTFIPYGNTGTGGANAYGFYKISTSTNVVTKIQHGCGWGQTCAWDSLRNRLWIPIQDASYNYLLIFDLNTNTIAYTSPNTGTTNPPFYGFPSAQNAYDPFHDVVYMIEEYSGTVYKLNAATGARISNVVLPTGGAAPAYACAFSNDYTELYITSFTSFCTIDTATMTITNTVASGGMGFASVMKKANGAFVFINNNGLYDPIVN
jgi:hypothetical protein